ncbi:MAG: lysostaphin resistance A-like protein [Candidatus Heimdallarchaeota archaeon]
MRKYSNTDLWLRVILFFAICVTLIFTFQVFAIPLARTVLNSGDALPLIFEVNLVRSMNGIVGVGLVYVFLKFDRRTLDVVGVSWDKKWGKEWILVGVPITLAGWIPTVIIELLFQIIEFPLLLDPLGIVLTFIITMFFIGFGEEILFRGYIQNVVETRYSFEIGTLVSGFLFGTLHFLLITPSQDINNMIAVSLSAFVIGITFSYVYKISGYNLIFPTVIHGFWDFFLFIGSAEFFYEDFLKVIAEIAASIVGAMIILGIVYYYWMRRLQPTQKGDLSSTP